MFNFIRKYGSIQYVTGLYLLGEINHGVQIAFVSLADEHIAIGKQNWLRDVNSGRVYNIKIYD